MREDAVINLKEHPAIDVVAPENTAATSPEMLFKIARSYPVIDDTIDGEPSSHERGLHPVLQIP